ncbi:MAG: hypothetical protein WD712_02630 [Candidatus Spechtbacterales bacterium]
MPIQTPLGQIRTMAEDLDTATKSPPPPPVSDQSPKDKPDTQVSPPASTIARPSLEGIPPAQSFKSETELEKIPALEMQEPARPKPEDLEKLLPLDGEYIGGSGTKKETIEPKTPPATKEIPLKKPMPDLENEIFPKPTPQEQEPGVKTPPGNLPMEGVPQKEERPSLENIPEETPEQILGTEVPGIPAPETETPYSPPKIAPEPGPEPEQEEEESILGMPPTPTPPPLGGSFTPPPTSVPRAPEGGFAERPKKTPNVVLIIGALVVLGAVLAGGAAFLIFSGVEVTEEPPQQEEPLPEEEPPVTQPVSPPAALLTPDFIQELSVGDTLESTLRSVIGSVAESGDIYPDSSIAYLPVRLLGPSQDQDQFITTRTFMGGLNLSVPEGFFDVVKPTFMLFVFGSSDTERIMCQNNLISETSCYGPRLGLILEAQEGKEGQLTAMMSQWMSLQGPQSNMDSLMLTDIVETPEEIVFETAEYRSNVILNAPTVTVNYANLPMPDYENLALSNTALDFATFNNKIIFATSKRSAEIVIDRLLQE